MVGKNPDSDFDFSFAERLASRGWLFTSHALNLVAQGGHGKDVAGLTFNEIRAMRSEQYPVIGAKTGVPLPDGYYSLIIDADGIGIADWLDTQYPSTFGKTLKTQGSKPAHFYFEVDGCPDSSVVDLVVDKNTRTRAVDVLSTGKMAVMPPSQHRKTKKSYRILRDALPLRVRWRDIEQALTHLVIEKNLYWSHLDNLNKMMREVKESRDVSAIEVKRKMNLFDLGLRPGLQSCPLPGHKNGDKHPSLSVKSDGSVFNCFSHHGGGDIFTWIMLRDGYGFRDALRSLAEKTGVRMDAVPRPDPGVVHDYDAELEEIAICVEDPKEARNISSRLRVLFAKWLCAEYHFATMEDTRSIYHYDGGIYLPHGEEKIEAFIEEKLSGCGLEKFATTGLVREVIAAVKRKTFIQRRIFDNHDIIVFEDMILDTRMMEMRQHSPDIKSFVKLPVRYDENATCPEFERFQSEILGEKDRLVMQEIFGYCLLKDYRFQKFFMFHGDGDNGKGQTIKVLTSLLGKENISGVSLQKIGNVADRFSVGFLYNKLANIVGDMPATAMESTGVLKMLTGGDMLESEEKGKPPIRFENYAKIICSANELPATPDDTPAFWRRLVVIPFSVKIQKEKRVSSLGEKIWEKESSGILNWALVGLRRLLAQNGFTQNMDAEETKRQYILRSKNVQAFIEENIEPAQGIETDKDDVYNRYRLWCADLLISPQSARWFWREFRQFCPYQYIETQPRKDDGSRRRVLIGVILKENGPLLDQKIL